MKPLHCHHHLEKTRERERDKPPGLRRISNGIGVGDLAATALAAEKKKSKEGEEFLGLLERECEELLGFLEREIENEK